MMEHHYLYYDPLTNSAISFFTILTKQHQPYNEIIA